MTTKTVQEKKDGWNNSFETLNGKANNITITRKVKQETLSPKNFK